jgi:plastocyanin
LNPAAHWIVAGALALATPASAFTLSGKLEVKGGKPPTDSVVYLAAIPGKSYPAPAEPAVMDQKLRVYLPHVLVVMRGQSVLFPNSDLVRHNVFSPSKTHRFNLGIYAPSQSKKEVFEDPGLVSLLCNVHPEMSAFILVVETPWHVLVGSDGSYRLEDVPPGHYTVVAWHEGMPEQRQDVELKGNLTLNLIVSK